MDSELKGLMQQFQQLQQKEVSSKINERNVVEVLQMLRKRNLVDVIYTFDGKEFLTWPQLQREVTDEVYTQGGRVDVVELPALLGVDLCHIEKVVPRILAEDPTTIVLEGELINQTYLDSVIADAAQTLKEQGSLSIAQLARSSRLSTIFLTTLLSDAVAVGTLKAVVDESSLHTTHFVAAQKMLLLTVLLAVTKPTLLSQLEQRHKLYPQLLPRLLSVLTETRQLPGRLEGTSLYIPACFEAQRTSAIHSYYAGSGYIPYDVLQRHGITHPKVYLQRYNPATTVSFFTVEGEEEGVKERGWVTGSSKKGGGGRKGKKGSKGSNASAAVGAAEPSVTMAALVEGPTPEQQQAYPQWGHFLQNCFLADSVLSSTLGSELEPFFNKEVIYLELADLLPSYVDLGAHPADAELVHGRLNALFPQLRQNRTIILGQTMLVDGQLFAELAPQAEYVAREDYSTFKPSKKTSATATSAQPSVKKNVNKLMILLQRKLQWRDLEADLRNRYLEELWELWVPYLDEIYAAVKDTLVTQGQGDVKKLRHQVDQWILEDFGFLCYHSKSYKQWAERQPALEDHLPELQKLILSSHVPYLCRGFVLLTAITYPNAFATLQEHCQSDSGGGGGGGIFSLADDAPLSRMPLDTLLEDFPSSVKVETVKLLAKMEAVEDGAALVDLLGELSTRGEISVPLNRSNKKAEKECFLSLKKSCLSKVQRYCAQAVLDEDQITVNGCVEGLLALTHLVCCLQYRAFVPLSRGLVKAVLEGLPDDAPAEAETTAGGGNAELQRSTTPKLLKTKLLACARMVEEQGGKVDPTLTSNLVSLMTEVVGWALEGEE